METKFCSNIKPFLVGRKPLTVLTFLFVCLLMSACNQKKQIYIEDSGEIFKTSYLVKYEYKHSLKTEIDDALEQFDASMNPFRKNSVIYKVNNNKDVKVDNYFETVFNKAKEVSEVSDGLFDITLSPLINAWGFSFKNMDTVTPAIIDSLKTLTGYKQITLSDGKVIKQNPNIQLNTSAIAKGYATDVIAELLELHGIDNYMVEIGGEIRAKGINTKEESWRVGIDRPREDTTALYNPYQYIIAIDNKAVATSGDYRKFYIKDGKRYAHTIDPRTGYPADNGILSATVIADDCMSADAYATVFMLADTTLTSKISKEQNLSYMLIVAINDNDYKIVKSDDFDKYVQE